MNEEALDIDVLVSNLGMNELNELLNLIAELPLDDPRGEWN